MCQRSRAAFVTSIGVQCVKISPIEHVTCSIEYCYYTIKINVAYQNNSFHDGQSYIVPLSERSNNSNVISSFRQQDKAFRVYSGIYCRANPSRSDELLQYSIECAVESFSWESVYA